MTFYGYLRLFYRRKEQQQMLIQFLKNTYRHSSWTTTTIMNLRYTSTFIYMLCYKIYLLMQRLHISFNTFFLRHRVRVAATIMTQTLTERHMKIKGKILLTHLVAIINLLQKFFPSKRSEEISWWITRITRYRYIVFINQFLLHSSK